MTAIRSALTEQPFKRSFLVALLGIAAAFGILLLRLSYFQIWKGDAYRNLSENNRVRLMEIHASRGRILDRNGEILADNRPCFDVAAIPEEIGDYEALEKILLPLSPLSEETLHKKMEDLRRSIPFRSHILWKDAEWNTMAYLETNRLRVPGVMIQVNQARNYLFGGLFAHVIGYMGEINRQELARSNKGANQIGDWIGKVGIEKLCEDVLIGKKGGVQVEVDARGRQVRTLDKRHPMAGKNVVLCLDRRLQEAARTAFGEEAGAAIAVDVHSGAILCYLSLPSYDANWFARGITTTQWRELRNHPRTPMTNRGIQGQYPPGSVFKIAMAMAGLEEGVLDPDEKLFCGGSYKLGRGHFRCWRGGGHGWVNLNKSLVESCDVYYYQIGQRLGIQKIHDYALRFGLGKKTSIRLRGERSGLIPSPDWKERRWGKPWYEGETLVASIGQGAVSVTPLQTAMFMAATANGGILWKPRLIERIEYAEGRVFQENLAERVGAFKVAPRTVSLVQNALRDVVESPRGTGKRARLGFVEVAGKTGTAQVVRQDRPKEPGETVPWELRDHAWFACYAPASEPEIALVVLVEHGGHGGKTAAPIARKILETFFSNRENPETEASGKEEAEAEP